MRTRTATRLQLFRFKCVTIVQQEYHKNISSSRGFCRFFERKCKKVKISRSEIVSQVQQVHPRYRKFVTSVLRFTVFRIVSSHLTCCILFFYTFSAVLFMHFLYVYSLICIFQSVTDFCVRFSIPFHSPPIPQPFSGLQPAFGRSFCNKNSTGSLFRAICAVPYSLHKKEERLRRAALPQFRLCYKKISRQSITEQPLLPRSA